MRSPSLPLGHDGLGILSSLAVFEFQIKSAKELEPRDGPELKNAARIRSACAYPELLSDGLRHVGTIKPSPCRQIDAKVIKLLWRIEFFLLRHQVCEKLNAEVPIFIVVRMLPPPWLGSQKIERITVMKNSLRLR